MWQTNRQISKKLENRFSRTLSTNKSTQQNRYVWKSPRESANEIKPLTTYNPSLLNCNKNASFCPLEIKNPRFSPNPSQTLQSKNAPSDGRQKAKTSPIFRIKMCSYLRHNTPLQRACNLFKFARRASRVRFEPTHNIPGYCSQQSFQCCGFMRYKSNLSGCIECCLEQGQDISVPQPQRADIWTTYMHTQFSICYAPRRSWLNPEATPSDDNGAPFTLPDSRKERRNVLANF